MAHQGRATPSGIAQMYEGGMSLPQIARKTGCTVKFIWERLNALGVKMRKRGGAQNGRMAAIKKAHENFKRRQQAGK
jgi:hypothetical protein